MNRVVRMSMVLLVGCVPRGGQGGAPLPEEEIALAAPVSSHSVAGCYRLLKSDGKAFQENREFWASPVRLDTTHATASFSRSIGEPEVFTFTSSRRRPPAEAVVFAPVWYVHSPDSLFLLRTGPAGGERLTLALKEGRLVGEWTSSGDAIDHRTSQPRIGVQLRRLSCPSERR
jgi:hypothetical protein